MSTLADSLRPITAGSWEPGRGHNREPLVGDLDQPYVIEGLGIAWRPNPAGEGPLFRAAELDESEESLGAWTLMTRADYNVLLFGHEEHCDSGDADRFYGGRDVEAQVEAPPGEELSLIRHRLRGNP